LFSLTTIIVSFTFLLLNLSTLLDISFCNSLSDFSIDLNQISYDKSVITLITTTDDLKIDTDCVIAI
jgi:hypothetical protein